MVKKLFLVALLGLNLAFFAPVSVGAQSINTPPEFNPVCWKCRDCKAQASKFISTRAQDTGCDASYFVQEAPCAGGDGEEAWGKCLAGGKAETQISFGGQNSFTDLGEFISKNYNFAITVVAILAVIVIIMSGFQWSMSGGNSEIISRAKHRIGNALIGLSIAYGSFFILSTINPNLVQLKLPPVYMVRPFSEMPKFCRQLEVENKNEFLFAFAKGSDEQEDPVSATSTQLVWDLSYNSITEDRDNCGERFFYKNSGSATCFGSGCSSGQMCSNIHPNNLANTNYRCEPASIIGRVIASYIIPPTRPVISGFEWPYIANGDSDNGIYKICWNNNAGEGFQYSAEKINGSPSVSVVDFQNEAQYFMVGSMSGGDENCDGFFIGYALGLDLNVNCTPIDSTRMIDKFGLEIGRRVTGGALSGVMNVSSSSLFTSDDLRNGNNLFMDVSSYKNY